MSEMTKVGKYNRDSICLSGNSVTGEGLLFIALDLKIQSTHLE